MRTPGGEKDGKTVRARWKELEEGNRDSWD